MDFNLKINKNKIENLKDTDFSSSATEFEAVDKNMLMEISSVMTFITAELDFPTRITLGETWETGKTLTSILSSATTFPCLVRKCTEERFLNTIKVWTFFCF